VTTRPFTVLLVDDHVPFHSAARAMLEATPGCVGISDARSGEEALLIADMLPPDLVLLDVNMAGLDGIETSRRLTSSRPDIVVVLVSADDDPELADAPSACGAATFVPKNDLRPSVVAALWERHAPAHADPEPMRGEGDA
jgi:DNA-binding NarL/FixJ family response regulator